MATISNMESIYVGLGTNVQSATTKINILLKNLTDSVSKINKLSTSTKDLSNDFSKLSINMNGSSIKIVAVLGKVNKGSLSFKDLSSSLDKVQQKAGKTMNKLKSLGETAVSSITKMDSAEGKAEKVSQSTGNTKKIDTEGKDDKKQSSTKDGTPNKIEAIGSKAVKAAAGLDKMVKSVFSLGNIKQGMDMVDQYINIGNGLSRINDGAQTQVELQNKIYAAANKSRTKYSDMASVVTKMGTLDTFKSNTDDLVKFTELTQKSLKMGGSGQNMEQVSSAMSDGKLQGDEFGSLMENPAISNAMTLSTGKSSDELMVMADQGAITADMFKTAMLSASDDINKSFKDQPMTFADIWTQVSNDAMQALAPLTDFIGNLLNSSVIQDGISWITQAVNNLVNFIVNNGSVIEAIIIAVGTVLLIVLASSAIAWVMAFLPILLIIGALALVIYILTKVGISFEDICGFIGGVIGAVFTFFYNIIMTVWNFAATFANALGNMFVNPGAAIKAMFCDLAVNILGFILKIAKGIESLINKIPGVKVDMTSKLTTIQKNIKAKSDEIKKDANLKEFVKTKDLMDYSDGVALGNKYGKKGSKLIGGALEKTSNAFTSKNPKDLTKSITGENLGTKSKPLAIQGTGSNGSVGVQMNNEDLSYLRDLAERDYIANVATNTLAPNISVSFGDVHENADADQIYGRIRTILKEEIAVAAEGVY